MTSTLQSVYTFPDGEFTFWRVDGGVFYQGRRFEHIVFRVRTDSTPEKRAAEKGITFRWLSLASPSEIVEWLRLHSDYFPQKIETREIGA